MLNNISLSSPSLTNIPQSPIIIPQTIKPTNIPQSQIIVPQTIKPTNMPQLQTNKEITGKVFVFTGARDKILEDRIEKYGGIVKLNLTNQTDYLVVHSSNKITKKEQIAKEKGIPILSFNDLEIMLNNISISSPQIETQSPTNMTQTIKPIIVPQSPINVPQSPTNVHQSPILMPQRIKSQSPVIIPQTIKSHSPVIMSQTIKSHSPVIEPQLKLKKPDDWDNYKDTILNKTFVFSGIRDQNLEKEITKRGGYVRTAISGKTDYLVTDDPHSSNLKVQKARDSNKIKIISIDELKQILYI